MTGENTLGRLFGLDRGARGVRAQGPPRREGSRRGRALALRRDHHLVAAPPLEGRAGARRSASSASAGSAIWGSSSPRRSARMSSPSPPRPARSADAQALGADEVVVSQGPRRDEGAGRQLRPDPQHGRGAARSRRLPGAAEARRDDGAGRRARRAAPLAQCRQSDLQAPQPRRLADRRHRRRRRRCSISAPSTASSPTSR